MKKFLPLLLVSSLFAAAFAQSTAFPPRLGETWRVDIDGLAPATLKFTTNSNALPGAIDGTAEMSGFAGRSRAASNQGRYLLLWTAKEGTYYCVLMAAQPSKATLSKVWAQRSSAQMPKPKT